MAASQPGNFNLQEFTDAGLLLAGGKLYTYSYGTTTQKDAYTDPAGTIPHTYTSDGLGGQYIALNTRGELPAPLYLATGSYDLALKRSDYSTVWTRKADGVDNLSTSLSTSLASSIGATMLGWIQAGTGAVFRWVSDKLRDGVSVKDFGATGDGVTIDYAAIVLAIAYCTLTGKSLFFPAGVYNIGVNTLTWANGVRYFGESMNLLNTKGSVILYSGVNDATQISNAINASTWAGITFNDLTFVCAAMASGKALLYDTGSSYLYIERCKFNVTGAGSYGIVLDQTEIAKIDSCVLEALGNTGTGALIWISNGATPKNPTGATYFTNRITVTNNQINPALGGVNAVGLRDDGGVVHTIEDNNFNGGKYCIQITNAECLSIKRNEIEGATTFSIAFTNAASGAISVNISDNLCGGGVPFLSLATGSIDRLTYNNNCLDFGAAVAAESGLTAGVSGKIFATQNRQRGIGGQPFNNYLRRDTDTVGTVTLYGATTAGVNTYSSQTVTWREVGDLVFFNINIALSAKDAAMSGPVRIGPLPFAAKTSNNGQTAVSIGGVSNIGMDAGYTQYSASLINGNSYLNLQEHKAGAASGNIDSVYIVATSAINISGVYAI